MCWSFPSSPGKLPGWELSPLVDRSVVVSYPTVFLKDDMYSVHRLSLCLVVQSFIYIPLLYKSSVSLQYFQFMSINSFTQSNHDDTSSLLSSRILSAVGTQMDSGLLFFWNPVGSRNPDGPGLCFFFFAILSVSGGADRLRLSSFGHHFPEVPSQGWLSVTVRTVPFLT